MLLAHQKRYPALNVNDVPFDDKDLLGDDERIQFRGLGGWVRAMRYKMRQWTDGVEKVDHFVDEPFLSSEHFTRLLDLGLVAAEASWRGVGGKKRKDPPPSKENDKTTAAAAATATNEDDTDGDDEAPPPPPANQKKRAYTPRTYSAGAIEARERERERKWELMYQQMAAFVKEHGHAIVPTKNVAFRPLRQWLDDQRAEYKKLQTVTKRHD
jgi:Helicase associated domain